jgi:solute carrier family 35 protein E3
MKEERQGLVEQEQPPVQQEKETLSKTTLFWVLVNITSTIGVVFTNKQIFDSTNLKQAPCFFTAYHFTCTFVTLFVMQLLHKFTPKKISLDDMLPLCIAFCGNVLLPNLSLAFSSVTVYQMARILVTPFTAMLNFALYSVQISTQQAVAIIPICLGIGVTTWADMHSNTGTSVLGVVFAFSGVLSSAIYVIWMGRYFRDFQVSSLQLLYNQAPISVVLLFFMSPYIDVLPTREDFTVDTISLMALSGGFAILINVSQFNIVNGTSALTSTIVGHLKTVSIVCLGWIIKGNVVLLSFLGVSMAIAGIVQYSMVVLRQKQKK